MKKYSKQKLNKHDKKSCNAAKQTKRISRTVNIDIYSLSVNKAISWISNQIFYKIYAKVDKYFTIGLFDIAPNILYTILFIVNCNECLSAVKVRENWLFFVLLHRYEHNLGV